MPADRFHTSMLAAHHGLTGRICHEDPAMLRAEALRQLRWQQGVWMSVLTAHAPGTPCLVASTDRAGLHNGLDLLRQAGEDVPSRFYRREAYVQTTAGGTAMSVRVSDLLVDITQALRWFDSEPSAQGQIVPFARPRPRAAVEPLPSDGLACSSASADSTTSGIQRPPGAGAMEGASSAGGSRHASRGGARVIWKQMEKDLDAAAGGWIVGDRVRARANKINVRTGSEGTVRGFSGAGGHPLVDFAGSGLVLIRAEHLEPGDDEPIVSRSPAARSSRTTRLSATPRPPAAEVAGVLPLLDWFDQPPLQ
jgi:hypothetical protein